MQENLLNEVIVTPSVSKSWLVFTNIYIVKVSQEERQSNNIPVHIQLL